MATEKRYCKITMECNPGICKSFVLNETNHIVQEHFLGYGTGNMAEYISLMYAVKESIGGKTPIDIITSSQTAFNWFINKNAKNNLAEDEEAFQITSIMEELTYINRMLDISRRKLSKEQCYVVISPEVKVHFIKQKEWLSIFRNRILTLD